MQIIAEQKLTEFAQKHSTSRPGLFRWLELMQQGDFSSVTELRETFRPADLVKKETPSQPKQQVPYSNRETTFTVFNIGGNKLAATKRDLLQLCDMKLSRLLFIKY